MRKRVLTILFAATLMAAVPVHAAENQKNKEMQLSTEIDSVYTLTIPADTDIEFNSAAKNLNGVLKVSGNVDAGEKVKVTAVPEALHNAAHNVDLPYTLNEGENIFQKAEWSETELRDGLNGKGKELQLSVKITEKDWKAAKAGTYTGGITFTAELQ